MVRGLDIVLHFEALTPEFGQAFWKFIDAGGYTIRQISDAGKPVFYRFQKPTDPRFPVMVELFARAPDGLVPAPGSRLTPIPLDAFRYTQVSDQRFADFDGTAKLLICIG